MKHLCGDANPKGNIMLTFKGGCRKSLKIKDAYRCVGCGGYFHKDCIIEHFKLEKECDWGRNEERKIIIKEITEWINKKSLREQGLRVPEIDEFLSNFLKKRK